MGHPTSSSWWSFRIQHNFHFGPKVLVVYSHLSRTFYFTARPVHTENELSPRAGGQWTEFAWIRDLTLSVHIESQQLCFQVSWFDILKQGCAGIRNPIRNSMWTPNSRTKNPGSGKHGISHTPAFKSPHFFEKIYRAWRKPLFLIFCFSSTPSSTPWSFHFSFNVYCLEDSLCSTSKGEQEKRIEKLVAQVAHACDPTDDLNKSTFIHSAFIDGSINASRLSSLFLETWKERWWCRRVGGEAGTRIKREWWENAVVKK